MALIDTQHPYELVAPFEPTGDQPRAIAELTEGLQRGEGRRSDDHRYDAEGGLAEAQETGASCCALPVPDTVKESDDAGRIVRTLDRSRLWLAQTPQTFRYDLLMQAHDRSQGEATDDAALVEALGVKVLLYRGSPRNLKVTTQEDLTLVEALLAQSS